MNYILFIFVTLIFLIITAFFALIPYITRRTESFGVSIPEEVFNDPDVKKTRSFYRNLTIFSGLISTSIMIICLFIFPYSSNQIVLFIIAFELFVFFAFYLNANKKMKSLKRKKGWMENKKQFTVVESSFRRNQHLSSPAWFILYFLITAITFWIGSIFYNNIPEKVAINYDLNLKPTRLIEKSPLLIAFAPSIQLSVTLLFIFIYYVISRSKQQIDPAKPEESLQKNKIFRYVWSNFIIFSGLILMLIFMIMQISFVYPISPLCLIIIIFIATFSIIVGSIYLSISIGQGGSRIKLSLPAEKNIVARDDDKYWKLGVFYFNPEDPAVFVEKRFGIGWTCNWARPVSWIIVTFLLLLILAIVIFSFKLEGKK